MKGYARFYTAIGRVYFVNDKIKIEDRLGRPGRQRWGVYFLKGTWQEDIGFPSLKKAYEYVTGRLSLRDWGRKP